MIFRDDDFDDTLARARVRAGLPATTYAANERDLPDRPEYCMICGEIGGGGVVVMGGEYEVKCPRCGDE